MKKHLWLIVGGALTLAALVGVWGLGFGLGAQLGLNEPNFRLELFKILWQFLLLVVLGGALGLFFKTQEGEAAERRQTEDRQREEEAARRRRAEDRAREVRATRRDSLLRTRADLVRAYNQAKAIRRLLRSTLHSANGQVVVRRDEYNSLMCRLIEAQLEFEYYGELVKSDRLLFSAPEDLKTEIKSVGDYLNNVVSEFEKAWELFAEDEKAPLEKFTRLKEFVQPFEERSPFETKFKKPFHEALRLLESTANDLP